jgi:gingipain R
MSTALALLTAGAAVAQSVQVDVLDGTPGHTLIHYSAVTYDSAAIDIGGQAHLALWMEGEGYFDEVGAPRLPHVCRSVVLPDVGEAQVRVVSGQYHDVPGVLVAPARGPISRDIDPATVPFTFGPQYSTDAWYPASPATLRAPYVMRDVRGVVVEANLLQYNPVTRTLRVWDELELVVATTGSGGVNPYDRASQPDRKTVQSELLNQRHFLNYQVDDRSTGPPLGDMLVISHGPFMAAMQPFVNWKNAIGMPTTIVDVATIGLSSTAIKNHIESVYGTSNLAYVLLVGDLAQMPSPSYSGGSSDPTYSLMTPDEYPDLYVGRFSAQTIAHVKTQVERTLDYEKVDHATVMGDWNCWGMGMASNQGPGHYGEDDDEHMDLIRDALIADNFATVDRIYDYFGTKAMVTNGLDEGRRILNYCGHGSTTSFGTTGFNNTDVKNLRNMGKLPFIHSVACVNGQFSASECFAEAWLRSTYNGEPIGAVATYMSSINQSWSPPMYAQANHGVGGKYGFADLFVMKEPWTIGALWYAGSATMIDLVGSSGVSMFRTWHCFGDPSLTVVGRQFETGLLADGFEASVSTPTQVNFTLAQDVPYAGEVYLVLASTSGSVPGVLAPGGLLVPLNPDEFTTLVLDLTNTPSFHDFFGTLDGAGVARPVLDTTAFIPLHTKFVGLKLTFAAVVSEGPNPFGATTEPRVVTLVL